MMPIAATHRPLVLNTAQPQRPKVTAKQPVMPQAWPRRAALAATPLLGAFIQPPVAAAHAAVQVGPAGTALLAMGGAFVGALLADRFISESPDDIANIPMGAVLGAAGAALLPALVAHGPASVAAMAVGAAVVGLWGAKQFAGFASDADARQMVKLAAVAGALLAGAAWTVIK